MDANLSVVVERLEKAAAPEEVFGELKGYGVERLASLKQVYRQIAKVTHPDVYADGTDKALAQAAFRRLGEWFALAEGKVRAGEYGSGAAGGGKTAGGGRTAGAVPSGTTVLRTGRGVYTVDNAYSEAGAFFLYRARLNTGGSSLPVTLKVPCAAQDNDLAQTEARVLQSLRSGRAAQKFAAYLPGWVEAFLLEDDGSTRGRVARQVNVFERQPGWHSLAEVRAAYPGGIDPKDAAWMFRRLLVALGFAHINGIIHGAVLPGSVFILPAQHGLRLDNWAYAARDPRNSGEIIAAIDGDFEDWYPDEARNSQPPAPATDIAMAARCVMYLLSGDPLTGNLPARVPVPMRMFLKSCILPGLRARPQDAWGLKEAFDELLEKLWGERKFHPFTMPGKP